MAACRGEPLSLKKGGRWPVGRIALDLLAEKRVQYCTLRPERLVTLDDQSDKYSFLDPPPGVVDEGLPAEQAGKGGKRRLWLVWIGVSAALLLGICFVLAQSFLGRKPPPVAEQKKVAAPKPGQPAPAAQTPPLPAAEVGKAVSPEALRELLTARSPASAVLAGLVLGAPGGEKQPPARRLGRSSLPDQEVESVADLVQLAKATPTPVPTPTPAPAPEPAVSAAGMHAGLLAPLGIELEIEQIELVLDEIHYDGESTSASINGKIVVEGRDYGPFRVLKIEPDKVTVRCPGHEPQVLTR